jgi:hypothetical protein
MWPFFMRYLRVVLLLSLGSQTAHATDAPPGQVHIAPDQILRGNFVEEHPLKGMEQPMLSSGHFVVAPGHGLIWGIEKPLATTSIVTQSGVVQDLGGMAIKIPAKNIRHIYDMVGAALIGDWSGLEGDFAVTRNGDAHHWQMLLVPRPGGNAKLGYATITVSGSLFIENIVMTKGGGDYDSFTFSNVVLSQTPLDVHETALFAEGHP